MLKFPVGKDCFSDSNLGFPVGKDCFSDSILGFPVGKDCYNGINTTFPILGNCLLSKKGKEKTIEYFRGSMNVMDRTQQKTKQGKKDE